MSESGTPPSPDAESQRPGAVLSADTSQRLVVGLLALWTLLSGIILTLFPGASAATIGGGLEGGEGAAAQRLLGVHLLALAPVFGLIAWEPQRYRVLFWLPYATQIGVVAAMLFDMATGKRDFIDGALPLIVAIIFLVLLLYVTFAGRTPEPPPAPAPATPAPADADEPAPDEAPPGGDDTKA